MNILEIEEIIGKLNEEIYEQMGEEQLYLEIRSISVSMVVEFLGEQLWNEDDDFREYINEVITEGILSSDERNNVINSPPEQFHIKLANAILKIVEKEDSNQKGRMLLLKQIGIF